MLVQLLITIPKDDMKNWEMTSNEVFEMVSENNTALKKIPLKSIIDKTIIESEFFKYILITYIEIAEGEKFQNG